MERPFQKAINGEIFIPCRRINSTRKGNIQGAMLSQSLGVPGKRARDAVKLGHYENALEAITLGCWKRGTDGNATLSDALGAMAGSARPEVVGIVGKEEETF